MNIQTIIDRASALLDNVEVEYELEDRRARLLDGLDSGLCEIARIFPLQARCRIRVEEGSALLPEQVLVPRALMRQGKRMPLVVEEGRVLAEDGEYTLIYYRKPPAVHRTDPERELPYPADLLTAMPFYCAALYVMGEDPNLYTRLMEQYNTKLSAAVGYRPAASVEGGGVL